MAFHSKRSFQRGDQVEVSSNMEGFLGSFWQATIVANMGTNYVVEYKDLVEEHDESTLLRETVMANQVRPLPPRIAASRFSDNNKVDAFDRDGWWVGKISGREGSDKYYVFFETTGEEIAYPISQLRFHLDWRNGKWISHKNLSKKRRKMDDE
ncbi:protein AGENET DOMAIN (AGD)-CONTAINING P1-like [Rosa sericea]